MNGEKSFDVLSQKLMIRTQTHFKDSQTSWHVNKTRQTDGGQTETDNQWAGSELPGRCEWKKLSIMTLRRAAFDNGKFIFNNMAGEKFLVMMSTFCFTWGKKYNQKKIILWHYMSALFYASGQLSTYMYSDSPCRLRGKCKQNNYKN